MFSARDCLTTLSVIYYVLSSLASKLILDVSKTFRNKKINFKNENTGEQISGTSLYIAFSDENTIGAKCE